MKKILALVVGGNQLLFAIQAKHTIHINDEFDIAYRNIDIDEVAAKSIFDNVYRIKSNDGPSKSKALRCFLNPEYAVKKYYANIDLGKYTDILFWHPDWLHYFLYKYSCLKKHKYHWHLLPEGLGLYLIRGYNISSRKKYGRALLSPIVELIDKIKYGYPENASNIVEDAYFIQAKYALNNDNIKQVNLLPFDIADTEFISLVNQILKYKHTIINDKIIILDGGLEGSRKDYYNPEKMDKIIEFIANKYGREKVLLKRKHDIPLTEYPKELIEKVTDYPGNNMPWELICLNNDIKNSLIISVPSSAVILPYIFSGFCNETYMIDYELLDVELNEWLQSRYKEIYSRISFSQPSYKLYDSSILD